MLIPFLVSMTPPTLSFNTGAPQAACQTLAPDVTQHRAQPQITSIPYVLNLSAFYDQELRQFVYTPDTNYDSKLRTGNEAVTLVLNQLDSEFLYSFQLFLSPQQLLQHSEDS